MQATKSLKKFNQLLEKWQHSLDNYTQEELLRKPTDDAWSMGQVYVHLINATLGFHLRQVEDCLASEANADEKKTMPGRVSYFLGSFPPIKIKVPASETYTPPQPVSKEDILAKMDKMREKMAKTTIILEKNTTKSGKTKHPAMGYLDAKEWFQMIPMHFQHHLRQKSRLDKFLGK
jgi:DinB superfamily